MIMGHAEDYKFKFNILRDCGVLINSLCICSQNFCKFGLAFLKRVRGRRLIPREPNPQSNMHTHSLTVGSVVGSDRLSSSLTTSGRVLSRRSVIYLGLVLRPSYTAQGVKCPCTPLYTHSHITVRVNLHNFTDHSQHLIENIKYIIYDKKP